MLYDEKRLQMTRDPEIYKAYAQALNESQRFTLSKIGNENSKWLLEEYVRCLKSEDDPLIYITDFMSWIDNIMIVYDCNTYYEILEKEMDDLMRGENETERNKKS